jgi:hypothetical protein
MRVQTNCPGDGSATVQNAFLSASVIGGTVCGTGA